MAQYGYPNQPPYGAAQNLQFYPSQYPTQPVSGHSTPFQAYSSSSTNAYGSSGFGSGFAGQPGVAGRMGEQGGLRTGWLAAFGTEGYDGEPPLLEELGVNFAHIKLKTLTVLNPLARIDQHIMDDSDLAGPVLFFLLFGFFLLFSGKLHFGYIYGLALLGSTGLHTILSLMAPPLSPAESSAAADAHPHRPIGSGHFSSTLTIARSASVLGYCLLPLVITSLVGIVLPMDTVFGYLLTVAAIAWCTYSSSAMFCAVGRMTSMRLLVAYPLALFYVGFGLMAIFSSRGSAGLQVKTATG
ncbi:Yip1-domain-containing protein [Trichodelitschia bisporula]|uniref:Protein YIP n=1 Tax=Trichodelitschia bisporula TaxID=703511 RepID=A0A6G1HK20_9PEZI|nr:Yip1-domain-containing protein [Trichodelitschia bisporula]